MMKIALLFLIYSAIYYVQGRGGLGSANHGGQFGKGHNGQNKQYGHGRSSSGRSLGPPRGRPGPPPGRPGPRRPGPPPVPRPGPPPGRPGPPPRTRPPTEPPTTGLQTTQSPTIGPVECPTLEQFDASTTVDVIMTDEDITTEEDMYVENENEVPPSPSPTDDAIGDEAIADNPALDAPAKRFPVIDDLSDTFGLSSKEFKIVKNLVFKMKKKDIEKFNLKRQFTKEMMGNDIIYRGAVKNLKQLRWIVKENIELYRPGRQKKIKGNNGNKRGRTKRKVVNFNTYGGSKWPSTTINYVFAPSLTDDDIKMLRGAIAEWEANTCIRFAESNSGSYLYFNNANTGCWSYVGKSVSDGPQYINTQTSACTGWLGGPVHEIGHALGLFHEQSRYDRDDYVSINFTNVQTSALSNFDKETASTLNTYDIEYDYGSVMHYGSGDFAINSAERTITTLDPDHQRTIGQRAGLSWHDAAAINEAYCSDACAGFAPLACQNGGYMDPSTCTSCLCPEGLGGTLCDVAAGNPGACETSPVTNSDSYLCTEDEFCVQSRNYGVGTYNNGDYCSYMITVPEGCQVQASFQGNFGTHCYRESTYPACFQWVEVKTKTDLSSRGHRFCCTDEETATLTSESNKMLIIFDARYPLVSNGYTTGSLFPSSYYREGFKICYKIADPSCLPTTTTEVPTTTKDVTEKPITMEPPITTEVITTEEPLVTIEEITTEQAVTTDKIPETTEGITSPSPVERTCLGCRYVCRENWWNVDVTCSPFQRPCGLLFRCCYYQLSDGLTVRNCSLYEQNVCLGGL